MDKIVALCKRRGFIFPSSEIYGGVGSTYDYGHYGVLLKANVKNEWWRAMITERDDIVAIDSAILQHPRVWEASGHLEGFTDPLVDCKTCGKRFRADHLAELECGRKPSKHPGETEECELTDGARLQPDVRDDDRPGQGVGLGRLPAPGDGAGHLHQLQERAAVRAQEAAVRDRAGRQVLPQRDHAGQLHLPHARVRADGDGVLRAARRKRERWFEHWLAERELWYTGLGIRPDHLRLRAHDADELSHYSSGTSDVEYLFPIGWSELEGIANRGDFDLTRHAEFSGEKLEYFDQASGERYVPHVIEPAAGADRATLAFLVDAYDEEVVEREGAGEGEMRTVLRLHPRLAPVKAAVLPLRQQGRPAGAGARGAPRGARGVQAEYDDGGSIGKRYRRQDEIGTPFCLTIDHQSLEDRTVTLRDRDSLAQERIADRGASPRRSSGA